MTMYQVTDRLPDGRTVNVPCGGIAGAVSAWLAELGTHTPLVEDLAITLRHFYFRGLAQSRRL